jgi:hypothetical protein
MALTAEQAEEFYEKGRDIMTVLAQAADRADVYIRKFEVQGGAAAMPEYATETGQVIEILNQLNTFLATDNAFPQRMLDLHRTDY